MFEQVVPAGFAVDEGSLASLRAVRGVQHVEVNRRQPEGELRLFSPCRSPSVLIAVVPRPLCAWLGGAAGEVALVSVFVAELPSSGTLSLPFAFVRALDAADPDQEHGSPADRVLCEGLRVLPMYQPEQTVAAPGTWVDLVTR
jgi:hypothetical protein